MPVLSESSVPETIGIRCGAFLVDACPLTSAWRGDRKRVCQAWGNRVGWPAVDEIEVIETEWGSELHQRLVAEEHAARVAWRNSPEARE